MKNRFVIDLSDGFVFGIAINTEEMQIAIIALIITVRFRKK